MTATICIVNQNTASSGNDFALDDLTLFEMCEVSDDVTIEVVTLNAFIAPPQIINCFNSTVVINGSGSTIGPGITYTWSTPNGVILSGENSLFPAVGAGGNYTLVVSGPNGCEAQSTIMVTADTTAPDILLLIEDIDCSNPGGDMIASSTINNSNYAWTGPGGFFR